MKNLREKILEAEKNKVAIGHFNISDLTALKAIFESAKELSSQGGPVLGGNVPVIIGTSKGEADFMSRKEAAVMVKVLREAYNFPIFLNADHVHTLENIKKAVEAGYDAVLFDGGKLPLEENIKKTKEVVDYVKSVRPEVLVEGELGYIGGSSKVLDEIPEGVAIKSEDLTKPEDAARFVKETGVDLLAPAVGNLHGMLAKSKNPDLNIKLIKEIHEAVGIPLVLHGGSGIKDEDFIAAIDAGISIVHINTELRVAWRKGLEEGLREKPEEVAPYKVLLEAVEEIKKVVYNRLKLFNRI